MSQLSDHAGASVEQGQRIRIITFTSGIRREVEDVLGGELAGHLEGLEGGLLLLDFRRVRRIGSIELGTLVGLHKRMKARGGTLWLHNLSPLLREVFAITRLDTVLNIRDEDQGHPPRPTDHSVVS